jgi:hypothetical protein
MLAEECEVNKQKLNQATQRLNSGWKNYCTLVDTDVAEPIR